MKVYIVSGAYEYEADYILSGWTTREAAELEIKRLYEERQKHRDEGTFFEGNFDEYYCEEVEIKS